jgi:deoxyribodipyrimidine photolyase
VSVPPLSKPRLKSLTQSMSTSSTGTTNAAAVSVYWYRNALRFHDNPSLSDACHRSRHLLPLYIIDPAAPFGQTVAAGCLRANFALESIQHVDETLRRLHNDTQMVVIVGSPSEVLPKVLAAVGATDLYYEREPAAPVRANDQMVLAAIQNSRQPCTIHGYDTHTLHPMETYLAKCKSGVAPATYGGFTKIFQSLTIPKEVPTVTAVPSLPVNALDRLRAVFGEDALKVPTLSDLGYHNAEAQLATRAKGGLDFVGGEHVALQLLERQVTNRSQWAATFEKPKTSPNALTVDTTGLSPCTLPALPFCICSLAMDL